MDNKKLIAVVLYKSFIHQFFVKLNDSLNLRQYPYDGAIIIILYNFGLVAKIYHSGLDAKIRYQEQFTHRQILNVVIVYFMTFITIFLGSLQRKNSTWCFTIYTGGLHGIFELKIL